jgi:hypothetical protein
LAAAGAVHLGQFRCIIEELLSDNLVKNKQEALCNAIPVWGAALLLVLIVRGKGAAFSSLEAKIAIILVSNVAEKEQ